MMAPRFILHLAFGGCLTREPVDYGITEDTGGHIAYILGAARAQIAHPHVGRVEIATRLFQAPHLPARIAQECGQPLTPLTPGLAIRRFASDRPAYLEKSALWQELPAMQRALEGWIAGLDRRPDVIHAHFADAAQVALALRRRFGIPVIYTPHSLGADKPVGAMVESARLASEARALSEADSVIVSSRDEAERQVGLYRGAALARVRQIRPGIGLPLAEAGRGPAGALLSRHLTRPELPFILAIARPVAKKNLAMLAGLYAASPALQTRANLVILAGQRPPGWGCTEQRDQIARIEALIAAHGLTGRLALPARHDRVTAEGLYAVAAAQAGVFANPALVEPFGLTTLEAAYAGLPCVVTAHGGAAGVVAGIGHGLVADPTDPAAFTAALLRLLTPGANAMAKAAAIAARPTLPWSRYAAQTLRVIDALLPPAAARPAPASPAPTRPAPTLPVPATPRTLLVSDIDGTLTGDPAAAQDFGAALAAAPGLAFAVATGRSVSEAWRVLDAWGLPHPAAVITSAGSELYLAGPSGRLALDRGYAAAMTRGWYPRRIAAALDPLPGLSPQAAIEQRRWKLGYLGTAEVAQAVRARLCAAGLAASVIHSHGSLIDVMPLHVDKAAAVRWLAARWLVPMGRVIVAGDSGNDLAMLAGPWRAILPGNADADLAGLAAGASLYRARAAHAAGVLEGLAHFGLPRAGQVAA